MNPKGLNKEDAIRVEKRPCSSFRGRYINHYDYYIFKCRNDDCDREIAVRYNQLHKYTGRCPRCCHLKRPFEFLYNYLKRTTKHEVALTYEEFLEFTKQANCTYCADSIPWVAEGSNYNKNASRAYYLDRIDNNKGYSVENCVVCCPSCNLLRTNRLSHDEMKYLMPLLKEYRAKCFPTK